MKKILIYTSFALVAAFLIFHALFTVDTFYAEGMVTETSNPMTYALWQEFELQTVVMMSEFSHDDSGHWGWTYIGDTPNPGDFGRTYRIKLGRRWNDLLFHRFTFYW